MPFTGNPELDVVLALVIGMPVLVLLVGHFFALRRQRMTRAQADPSHPSATPRSTGGASPRR